MGELHRRFAPALAGLADTDGLTRTLDVSNDRGDWWPAGVRWKRIFGRFEPERSPYATLAFETVVEPAVIVLVRAHAQRPEQAPSGAWIEHLPEVGHLHVRAFPDDPRLSTLAAVVSGSRQVRVVRYRPEKRCTLRIGEGRTSRWTKVFAGSEGDQVHRRQVAVWAASQRGELDVAVAEPIGFDAATRAVWIGHVPGEVLTSRLFGNEGPELAHRLGVAAGSVTRMTTAPEVRMDGPAQLE
ncbi:MAG: hypothetical protein M3313_08420, partial [Actinomycetota bacterium]|nr:hypothetical protein [Actinomycetota bacterium]